MKQTDRSILNGTKMDGLSAVADKPCWDGTEVCQDTIAEQIDVSNIQSLQKSPTN